MLEASEQERQHVVDYIAAQARDEKVGLLQKVYSEQVYGIKHDIWDVHTDRARWWVITNPTNLYSQEQFPNMDIALTFHVGMCLRIPRSGRQPLSELQVEPVTACWRSFQQASDALSHAEEIEDFQAIGVRCRESLVTLAHAVQDAVQFSAAAADLKRSDFRGWSAAIADTLLPGESHRKRRSLLKSSAEAAWEFVNWIAHSRTSHINDAEAAIGATEFVLSLFTTVCIRHLRGVPDACPSCGSQRLVPERGTHTGAIYERAVCAACGWTGQPVLVEPPTHREDDAPRSEGDCVVVEVPLRGPRPPDPSGRE